MDINNAIVVLRALKSGEEVQAEGRTYVWLDNYPTQVIGGVQYGIDGLAIKGESFEAGSLMKPGTGKVHYMGRDMSLNYFVDMCDKLPEEDIERLRKVGIANAILKSKYTHKPGGIF